jgi:hypothetical protein
MFESQDVGQRYQRAHAMDLGQQRNLWLFRLPEINDLAAVFLAPGEVGPYASSLAILPDAFSFR